ncbi:MAG TPA: LysR substrate-binding domain-containing protein [Kofleriaceae bacterium]
MDQVRCLEAFVLVAETASFAAAARRLGVAKSVVSMRVQQLEEWIEAPLFHRTTRAVRLTQLGAAFQPECAELLASTARMFDRMREMKGSARGALRIHVLPGYAFGLYDRHLRAFCAKHPEIELEVVVSDAVIDPAREGFDCTIQIFEPVSDNLVQRKLFAWRPVFCASPAYAARHGLPRSPEDLTEHRIGLYSRYPRTHAWEFRRGKTAKTVALTAALRSTSVQLLRDFARAGDGIAALPTLIAADDLTRGELVPVLRTYALPAFWLSAVYPSAAASMLRLKLFLAELSGEKGLPPWDRELVGKGLVTVFR